MDLTEAKDIKKRWKEYTEELYKKDLHDPDNHDGVITHLDQTSRNVKSSVEAGNPVFPRLVQVTSGGFSWWL